MGPRQFKWYILMKLCSLQIQIHLGIRNLGDRIGQADTVTELDRHYHRTSLEQLAGLPARRVFLGALPPQML